LGARRDRLIRHRAWPMACPDGRAVRIAAGGAAGGRVAAAALARPHDGILGYVPGVAGMHDVDDYPGARQVPGLVVYRYDAPLCFANAEDFRRRALAAATSAPSALRWFLLNAEANVEVDSTAADALAALHAELKRRGVVFAMARVKQDLRDQLARAGLIDAIGEDRIFMTLPTAVAAYRNWHQQRFGLLPDDSITGA
ncbi:MAG: STAS domain-containing protein, partial [Pseudonocardiaceae bacterium]